MVVSLVVSTGAGMVPAGCPVMKYVWMLFIFTKVTEIIITLNTTQNDKKASNPMRLVYQIEWLVMMEGKLDLFYPVSFSLSSIHHAGRSA